MVDIKCKDYILHSWEGIIALLWGTFISLNSTAIKSYYESRVIKTSVVPTEEKRRFIHKTK